VRRAFQIEDHDCDKRHDRDGIGREDLDRVSGLGSEVGHQAMRSCAMSALRRRARISVRVR
jgi:hypothetical protein